MVKDDPLDNENPRSHTANNIHVDNKREEMSIMVSSVNDQYKTAALDFQKDKTTTDRPRLQGQASVRVATPT
ncbi:hypothetical protein SETIT_3G051700v2 [Setaria italica]|uniref:Uncharacterized protein n=2 Tax=Setaria TaxID=4554 RepID=A0A368QDP6_SETIT|nr:hypothetical protein SETIT_3G051700v2 [Setaria italica]TKW24467.1 hypothetical protein SEVIR_3G052200v2 [Setaria viridis]